MEAAIDWTPDFLAVLELAPKHDSEPGGPLAARVVHEGQGFPDADENFVDFLHFLVAELLAKKPDTGSGSPCKVWSFPESEKGEADRQLLEDKLLMATDLKGFKAAVKDLGERFPRLPGVRPGLVIVLRFNAVMEGQKKGGRFAATFQLDYQDAHRLEHEAGLSLVGLPGAVLKKLARGLLYPYTDHEGPRHDLCKVFSRPASDPFPSLLALTPPPTTETLLQGEVARALFATGRAAEERYKPYFDKSPPRRRELFGEDRFVRVKDLIPPTEAEAVARESARTARDLYGKDQRLKLDIDGVVTLDARLDQLGESFFFAEKDGEKYVLIKGKRFLSARPQLSSVDFLKVDSLEEAIDRLAAAKPAPPAKG